MLFFSTLKYSCVICERALLENIIESHIFTVHCAEMGVFSLTALFVVCKCHQYAVSPSTQRGNPSSNWPFIGQDIQCRRCCCCAPQLKPVFLFFSLPLSLCGIHKKTAEQTPDRRGTLHDWIMSCHISWCLSNRRLCRSPACMSKDFHVSKKLCPCKWIMHGVGLRSLMGWLWKCGGLRSPEQINPSRITMLCV